MNSVMMRLLWWRVDNSDGLMRRWRRTHVPCVEVSLKLARCLLHPATVPHHLSAARRTFRCTGLLSWSRPYETRYVYPRRFLHSLPFLSLSSPFISFSYLSQPQSQVQLLAPPRGDDTCSYQTRSLGSKYTKMWLQTHFGVFRAQGTCLVAASVVLFLLYES